MDLKSKAKHPSPIRIISIPIIMVYLRLEIYPYSYFQRMIFIVSEYDFFTLMSSEDYWGPKCQNCASLLNCQIITIKPKLGKEEPYGNGRVSF